MECNVYLGGPSQFELQGAILVYTGGHAAGRAFAANQSPNNLTSIKLRSPIRTPRESGYR